MVKLYNRYDVSSVLGVVYSSHSNLTFTSPNQVLVPRGSTLCSFNVRSTSTIPFASTESFEKESPLVTCILKLSGESIAVGHSDGSIKVYSNSNEFILLHGHSSSVLSLAYDPSTQRLASGSSDTNIVIWDLIQETGLYRLIGHKDQISSLVFVSSSTGDSYLLSGSKDSLLKIWDLTTQLCIETNVSHRHPIGSLLVLPYELSSENDDSIITKTLIFTGTQDGIVRIFDLNLNALSTKLIPADSTGNGETTITRALEHLGDLEHESKEKIMTMLLDATKQFIGIQGSDRMVQIFKIASIDNLKKRIAKLKKKGKQVDSSAIFTLAPSHDTAQDLTLSDRFPSHCTLKCSAKVRSFDMLMTPDKKLSVVCGLTNNSLEVYELQTQAKSVDPAQTSRLVSSIDQMGHRSDIRVAALSSDDAYLMTASSDSLKVWSISSNQCLKTMECGYALCGTFLPGNNHIVLGTKTGELQLFDLASSSMIGSLQAHEGPIWSLCMYPDKSGFATGSQDKQVKFWDILSSTNTTSAINLSHSRTLKLTDDVLCIKFSHDFKVIAVALLDTTVKVFYVDTLKFLHSLYGHKLPVLAMDISSDGSKIATASSDKSLKIWGLDFGDCQKSFLAHDDSVMCCQFVFGTHYVFTASKDRTLKFWDTDSFEHIMTVRGHHGEIWTMTVGKYGRFVATGSHDRTVRIWKRTDDQFALEEERERELEMLQEDQLVPDEKYELAVGSGADGKNPADDPANQALSGRAATKSAETLKSGEKILEALEIYEGALKDLSTYETLKASASTQEVALPPVHPLILATGKKDMSAGEYVLHVMVRIPSSQLYDSLLVLPFSRVGLLLECCTEWLKKKSGTGQRLACKIIPFLLQTHHYELTSTRLLSTTLSDLSAIMKKALTEERERIGRNVSALIFLMREYDAERSVSFGEEAPLNEAMKVEETKSKKRIVLR